MTTTTTTAMMLPLRYSFFRRTRASLATTPATTRLAHTTVRVILTADLPDQSLYANDIIDVKAGYARNYLIPQKKALYAIPENFERLGLRDPLAESPEERRVRVEREQQQEEEVSEEQKAADLLRKYLGHKMVRTSSWRDC
jgi:hypothetical protein